MTIIDLLRIGSLSRTTGMSGFVQIPRQVDLSLMVGFVPSQKNCGFADGSLDVIWEIGNFC